MTEKTVFHQLLDESLTAGYDYAAALEELSSFPEAGAVSDLVRLSRFLDEARGESERACNRYDKHHKKIR